MDMKLKDKLALVSGSTAGIGYAIAAALAGEGARVVVNGRSPASVDAAVAKITGATGAHVHGFAGDLSTAAAAERRHARGQGRSGRVGFSGAIRGSRCHGEHVPPPGGARSHTETARYVFLRSLRVSCIINWFQAAR